MSHFDIQIRLSRKGGPRTRCHGLGLLGTFLIIGAIEMMHAQSADGGQFSYQNLYDQDSGVLITGAAQPSLNDAGFVAFLGQMDSNSGPLAIVTGNGGPLTTIAIQDATFTDFGRSPAINNLGSVLFAADMTNGQSALFTGNGMNIPTRVSGSLTGDFTNDLGVPGINDSGRVIFNARVPGGTTNLYVGDGGTPTLVANGGSFMSADINNSGTVAWAPSVEIVRWSNGVNSTAESTAGPFSLFTTSPAINSHGAIVFWGRLDAGGEAIAINDGTTTTTILSSNALGSLDPEPGINDAGDIVFRGVLGGPYGLFTGPDPIEDVVVFQGMSLFGATVQEFTFFRHGLNNNGQIAFAYSLSNGRNGIALATPRPIAEPTCLTIVLAGLPIMLLAHRARR